MTQELGCTLTEGQKQVALSVRDNKVTVVQSANAVGKTYVAAGIALWFLMAHRRSKIITTAAPPLENLKRLLWGEIGARAFARPEVFKGVEQTTLQMKATDDWWLVGRSIPGSGTAAEREAKFSGVHAPYLLFIVDEGDAVPNEVYRGIDSCMSNQFVRLLVMFNPRAEAGPVYQMIRDQQANVIRLSAFEHPNVITGKEVIPGAVARDITVLRIHEWSRAAAQGEEAELLAHTMPRQDSDWFQVPEFLDGCIAQRKNGDMTTPLRGNEWRKISNPALAYMVLARFPAQTDNQLISRSWVEAAMTRWLSRRDRLGDKPPEDICPIHGQDVAEFGVDQNAACLRYGSWVDEILMWSGVDIPTTGDKAARLAFRRRAKVSFVDGTGVGSGVAPQMERCWEGERAQLRMPGYEGRAVSVKVASAATEAVEEGEFGNLRDQLLWRLREWLRTDPHAMLPPDDELADELCTPTYQIRNGKLKVMDKPQMRKLLGRSPDKLDALALTFAPVPPETTVAMGTATVATIDF